MKKWSSMMGAVLAAAMAASLTACSGMETGAGQEIKGAPGFEGLEPVELIEPTPMISLMKTWLLTV